MNISHYSITWHVSCYFSLHQVNFRLILFSLLSLYIYIVSFDLYMFTTRESQNLGERPTDIFFTLIVSSRRRWINKGMLKLFFTPGLRIKFLEYRDLLCHSFSRYILCLGILLDLHPRSKIIFSPLRIPLYNTAAQDT